MRNSTAQQQAHIYISITCLNDMESDLKGAMHAEGGHAVGWAYTWLIPVRSLLTGGTGGKCASLLVYNRAEYKH